MIREYFGDFHIHIGRTKSGRPVKITGSKTLTLEHILYTAAEIKGMDIIGIIDCHVPEVLAEMEALIQLGEMEELTEGGIMYRGKTTLIPGSEIEINDDVSNGPIHVLAYFPTLELMKGFSFWMSERMKNIHLSSQRIYASAKEVQQKVKEMGGLFIPAHVFTPYKSLYGKGVNASLGELLDPEAIDAIELGLSSDTFMADEIAELHDYPYVTNSDAHSLEKIAREYQKIALAFPSYNEFVMALKQCEGRGILANYGLDPRLGKYHKTVCDACSTHVPSGAASCPKCGSTKIVKGVSDRIAELSGKPPKLAIRPPYIHQVPLEFIPKLGKKTLNKLRDHFKTDMAILHEVPEAALLDVAGPDIAEKIMKARKGELEVSEGGGGIYGAIKG